MLKCVFMKNNYEKNLGLTWKGTSENSSSPTNMENVLTRESPMWSKNFGFSSSSLVILASEWRRMKKPRPKAMMKREYQRRKVRKVVRTLKNMVEYMLHLEVKVFLKCCFGKR